jgi:predicted PhzF superfamily epimerase YddE/YHI9
MIYTFTPTTEVRLADHKTLKAFYRAYRMSGAMDFVGRFLVEKPLTSAQLRRLPKALCERVAA